MFCSKDKIANEFGKHEQYGFKAYTKKEVENEAALHVIKHLQDFNNNIIKNVSERKLHELKYELKDFKDANKKISRKP